MKDNKIWSYDRCILCLGKGKNNNTGKPCVVCNGEGFWEFVSDINHLAVQVLLGNNSVENEQAKIICNRRLPELTPDNYQIVLRSLSNNIKNEDAFNAIHAAGASKWSWAWTHTNRFAIELCRLCGGVPTDYPLALSRLAWKWLSEEENENSLLTSKV